VATNVQRTKIKNSFNTLKLRGFTTIIDLKRFEMEMGSISRSGAGSLPQGQLVFPQVMAMLPWQQFQTCVERYQVDRNII
jgi:hypothetical protein